MSTLMMLETTTTIHDAIEALSAGNVEKDQLLEWLNATPLDMTQAQALYDVLTPPELFEFMGKQQQMAVQRASKASTGPAGALRFAISKRGAVSLYGINRQFPITMYVAQWERAIEFIKSDKFKEFLATKPVGVFSVEKDYARPGDKEFIDTHPTPANISIKNDVVTVNLAMERPAVLKPIKPEAATTAAA